MNLPAPKLPQDSLEATPPQHPFLRHFIRVPPSHEDECRYRIRWRRLVAAGIGGLMSLYVLLGCGAFLFVHYRQHIEAIGVLDLLLPSRWGHYRIAQGDDQIAAA